MFWEIYRTAKDDEVCENCAPFDDQIFRSNMGPQPPLHPHCRCKREFIDPESDEFLEWAKAQRNP